jgi:hypothetical protein
MDLGLNNTGSFGPAGLDEEERRTIVQSLAEYGKPASNCWCCVDGRLPVGADLDPSQDTEFANPQIAGSLPISESMATYMDEPEPRQLSETVAIITRQAVDDGVRIKMHGDEQNGKAGCKANADSRGVLRFNAENADIVAPIVWGISQGLELDEFIEQDDILTSIGSGKAAADNEALWDVTPEEVVDIAIANGAEYEVFRGFHYEVTEKIDLTREGAFDKRRFVRDFSTDVREIQAFAASFGKYKAEAFRRAALHGRTERDAALQTMRVILFNVGISKVLMSDDAKVGVVTQA